MDQNILGIINTVYIYEIFFLFSMFKIRAGKPPTGMHLDVTKEGKLIEVCFINLIKNNYKLILYNFYFITTYNFLIINAINNYCLIHIHWELQLRIERSLITYENY